MRLHKTTFDFSNLFETIDDDYEDYYSDSTPKENLPTNPYKLLDIPLTDIGTIQLALNNGPHRFKDQHNNILTFIE